MYIFLLNSIINRSKKLLAVLKKIGENYNKVTEKQKFLHKSSF